jgi:hypothetical protein
MDLPRGTLEARLAMKLSRAALLAVLASSCGGSSSTTSSGKFHAHRTDTRFHTADHFLASMEMQISGEPFAQLLGRSLSGYDRFNTTPDLYFDPATGKTVVDPLSYSLAIESYEYSKQPMNNTSMESGAGLSLEYAPTINPDNVTGDAAFALLRDRLQYLAQVSSAGGATKLNWVVSPAPTDNPFNVYGWPGYWPVFAEFQSFATDILPTGGATRGCSLNAGYAASSQGRQAVGDYECGYNSLNLPNRDMQVTKVLDPSALGFAMWKQGLWVINYWQGMHDLSGNTITSVAEGDLSMVGVPNNGVVGQMPDPNDPTGQSMIAGAEGTFLGDIILEGWQGLTLLEEMNAKSVLMLTRMLTTDGMQLGGFASTKEAIAYGYSSNLQWWPAEVAVTEVGAPPMNGNAWRDFPEPTSFAVQTPESRLRGLAAMLGGFAELFALTDGNNPDVGGAQAERATFDGDPFPADNGQPDGEESPHDRALANIKVAVVNLDRLHFDTQHNVLVDEATASSRGTTASTVDVAYSIVGLRTAWRSISSTLALYSNDKPDTHGLPNALDAAPNDGAPAPISQRMLQLLTAQADFLAGTLVDSSGAVANSYDLSAGKRDASPTTLESEAGAIRGLLDAYLATSDTKYRDAAQRVFGDLQKRFWMKEARAFRTTAGVDDPLTWTPLVFGTLQGALRQYWKLVGNRPGNEAVAAQLLAEIVRTNKLVANGWDDANQDDKVQFPDECTGAGLQMGERALTGELSLDSDDGDRDHDCVMEISAAKLPAALAGELILERK